MMTSVHAGATPAGSNRLISRWLAGALLAALAGLALLFANAAHADGGRIIVSGASGQLGTLVIEELLARGVEPSRLILVSRSPDKLASYAEQGATVRFGDFTQPESLPAAYEGGDRMLLISVGFDGPDPRPVLHGRAIDAARTAGVRHIAYTSFVGISNGVTTGLAEDHLATEQLLRDSGLEWTFLRNSIYAEVLLGAARDIATAGRAVVPTAEHPIAYVTRRDCAAAAAAVLSSPDHAGKAYDITGPAVIGVRAAAEAVAAATGREIAIVPADAGGEPTSLGFTSPGLDIVSDHVEVLTGRPATSMESFFSGHRATLLGNAE